jgi:Acetyltransferase (GNAT) domain
LKTCRLCLRVFELADLDVLAKINNDPEVMRHTGDGNPVSREETEKRLHAYIEHWKQHGFGLRAAIHKSDHAFIAFCGLQFVPGTEEIEVGFRLAKSSIGDKVSLQKQRERCFDMVSKCLALSASLAWPILQTSRHDASLRRAGSSTRKMRTTMNSW